MWEQQQQSKYVFRNLPVWHFGLTQTKNLKKRKKKVFISSQRHCFYTRLTMKIACIRRPAQHTLRRAWSAPRFPCKPCCAFRRMSPSSPWLYSVSSPWPRAGVRAEGAGVEARSASWCRLLFAETVSADRYSC